MQLTRRKVRIIVSSLLAVFFLLYLILTTEITEIPNAFSTAKLHFLLFGALFFTISLVVKLYRWHILFPKERSFIKYLPVYTSAYAAATAFPMGSGDFIAM